MSDQSASILQTEFIRTRRSWRTYSPKSVEPGKKESIRSFFAELGPPPFGSEARFKIIDFGPEGPGRISGTYGVIKGASTFLAGAVRKNSMDLEDFGYLFEKIILFAGSLGLNTCWMGATFSRSLFSEKIELDPGETLPAVSPLGYRAGRRSFMDSAFHFGAGSKSRKPWSHLFFNGTTGEPLIPEDAEKLAVAFEMVRLAPSAVNKQPWRLVRDGKRIHFFMERTRGFERRFKTDLQRIDMGIAMCHFEIGAIGTGIKGEWKIERPDAALLPGEPQYLASWIT